MTRKAMDVLNELVPEDTTQGQMVRAFRKKIKMTLAELSDLTGIAETHLSAIENDKMEISLKNSKKIAAALGVGPTDILFPNGEYKKDKEILKIEKKFQKYMASKKVAA